MLAVRLDISGLLRSRTAEGRARGGEYRPTTGGGRRWQRPGVAAELLKVLLDCWEWPLPYSMTSSGDGHSLSKESDNGIVLDLLSLGLVAASQAAIRHSLVFEKIVGCCLHVFCLVLDRDVAESVFFRFA